MGIDGYGGVVEQVECESCEGGEEVGCEDCKWGVEKGGCVEMAIWQVSSDGNCKEVEMYVRHMYWLY